jgi:dihydrofolate reductase
MKNLSIIVAAAENYAIGINNTLPWHLPEDLKRFRALTMGHHIVMGRKTYESLGRLLPGRIIVIVTRNKDYRVDGAIIAHSLQDAVQQCDADEEVFLIGGAELYKDGLPLANKLYLTKIHATYEGDAFFPDFLNHPNDWQLVATESHLSAKNLSFSYLTYVRN